LSARQHRLPHPSRRARHDPGRGRRGPAAQRAVLARRGARAVGRAVAIGLPPARRDRNPPRRPLAPANPKWTLSPPRGGREGGGGGGGQPRRSVLRPFPPPLSPAGGEGAFGVARRESASRRTGGAPDL